MADLIALPSLRPAPALPKKVFNPKNISPPPTPQSEVLPIDTLIELINNTTESSPQATRPKSNVNPQSRKINRNLSLESSSVPCSPPLIKNEPLFTKNATGLVKNGTLVMKLDTQLEIDADSLPSTRKNGTQTEKGVHSLMGCDVPELLDISNGSQSWREELSETGTEDYELQEGNVSTGIDNEECFA